MGGQVLTSRGSVAADGGAAQGQALSLAALPLRRRLRGLLLQQALQQRERQQGTAPEEAALLPQALAASPRPGEQMLARAEALGQRLGLVSALGRWRARLPWLALGCGLLVGLLCLGLLQVVVGGERRLNGVAALLALLGPHLISLLLWLGSLVWGGGGGGMAAAAAGLLARLPGPAAARANERLLLQAGLALLQRQPRLAPWALGALNHAVWAAALGLASAGLWFSFAFRAYELRWESTLLDAEFFAALVGVLGWLPARLGFALPDLQAAADHRGWALWLLGCTLVWGLGLRLLLLAVSLARSLQLAARLALDGSDPALRAGLARLAALAASSRVIDAERRPAPVPPPPLDLPPFHGLALLGHELPPALDWPPPGFAGLGGLARHRVSGTAAERQALLASLQDAPPARLLIVCHGPASPDRGSERLLRAALQRCGHGAMLLVGGGTPAALARWQDWARQVALPLQAVFVAEAPALAWLQRPEGGDHG